jgi:biopolymer transport protein ExbD
MIDVTFQLLIFFVCANTWSHLEANVELELAAPIRSAREPEPKERPRLTINLREDGQLIVQGRATTPEQLGDLLRREHRRRGEALEVYLRAHRKTPYVHTREVLNACTRAGIRQVHVAVLKEKEK